MRVHTNIAQVPNRRLPQIWGAGTAFDAISTTAPNALHTNRPNISDAMGWCGQDGVVSMVHDFVASDPDLSLYFWCNLINQFNPALGWILANEDVVGNTKTVPGNTLCSFTAPEGSAIYIQSSTIGIRNLWLAGSRKHSAHPYPDMLPYAANTV